MQQSTPISLVVASGELAVPTDAQLEDLRRFLRTREASTTRLAGDLVRHWPQAIVCDSMPYVLTKVPMMRKLACRAASAAVVKPPFGHHPMMLKPLEMYNDYDQRNDFDSAMTGGTLEYMDILEADAGLVYYNASGEAQLVVVVLTELVAAGLLSELLEEETPALLARMQAELDAAKKAHRSIADQAHRLMQERDDLLRELAKFKRPDEVATFGQVSALDFYDAVLTINNFADVYDPRTGWSLRSRPDFDLCKTFSGVRVITLGPFNSGKTWLIGRLSGNTLPSGTSVHTQGISIKQGKASGLAAVLLDTVGTNSPIGADSLPAASSATASALGSPDIASLLEELRTQEDFYRQLCFSVGNVLLLVLGQMSHKDQTDLVMLTRSVFKEKTRKNIIVVHNLREWSREQLLFKAVDGRNYLERNAAMFGLDDVSLDVTMGSETRRIERHSRGGVDADPVLVRHYYLTNDGMPCSLNKFVIQDMITFITTSGHKKAALGQELAKAATDLQNKFALFTDTPPEIKFDRERSSLVADLTTSKGPYGLKSRSLTAYFAANTNELVYNITAVPCTVEAESDDEDDARCERQAYILQIELPGLTEESQQKIQQNVSKQRWISKQERQEGGVRVVKVEFTAELVNVPKAFFGSVQEKRKRWALTDDIARHWVAEEGTRTRSEGKAHFVKVLIWTNITNYDTSKKPFVTYHDGILSITVISEPP